MNRVQNLFIKLGRIRFSLVLMVISLGLWVAFVKLVVPPLIESAYRGESLPVFNGLIHGQHVNPLGYYLEKWDTIASRCLIGLLLFWPVALLVSSQAFFRKFVGEATPGSLGAIRMWTCAVLLLMTVLEDFPSIALLPLETRDPKGMLEYFYRLPIGFDQFVTSEKSLRAFQLLTEVLLVLGVVGWRTRIVIPLGAFCHFVLLGTLIDHSFFWHQNLVLLYVMAVLSFTPCGDGWSVDRLLKIYRGGAVPSANRTAAVYGWSRYACWAMIAFPYLANGLSKLEDGGLFWWNATNMRSMLYGDALKPREFGWALSLHLDSAPDIFFALLGIVALATELSFVIVLFSRVARRTLPIAAMMMHLGIFLLQRILFLDLILLQLVFFDFTQLRKAIARRLLASRGPLQVLYDGLCPFCCRTVRLLNHLDLFSRLEFLDFRRLDLNEYNRRHSLNLAVKDVEEEMYVISQRKACRGFYGYRRVALALPPLWPVVPWLFLPGVSLLGAIAYRFIARNRQKLLWCDSHCSVQPAEPTESIHCTPGYGTQSHSGYALMVSGITVVALLCWFYRIEFYPFTSWHLYSGLNTSGKIGYYKVLAQYESGITSNARLEDGIGALAFDGRYSPFLEQCFGEPREIDSCKKFLTAEASVYNKARPEQKITHYEIQHWTWDFRANPLDPERGNLVKRFVHQTN
jgi:predicted DCC family thiol-disulfide oxidoreductase YuxK